MTVQSFTNEHITYETTETTCSCPAKHFNPSKVCKHQLALQMGKDATFQALRQRYDFRLNGQEETRRCYRELANCY